MIGANLLLPKVLQFITAPMVRQPRRRLTLHAGSSTGDILYSL